MKLSVKYYISHFLFGITLVFLLFSHAIVSGQESKSPKAQKHFIKARDAFETGDYKISLKEIEQASEDDSAFAEAYILWGDILMETGQKEDAVEKYRKSLAFDPAHPEIVYNILANALFSMEKYAEACPYYQSILDITTIRPELRKMIVEKLSICQFRQQLIGSPVDFKPVNLGTGVNSRADEYVNAISADNSMLYLTRREKALDQPGKEYNENFYISKWKQGLWDTAARMGYPEGTENDAGGLCISPDGNLMVFTSCFRQDGFGSCDLYYSERVGNRWTPSRNMGEHINSDLWDAQPSISSDGQTIYFASNRRGGYGSSDIWAINRLPNGGWGKPYNLGPVINSAEAEMAPYIHYDDKTLYFSSKGHPGLGGVDLFKSSKVKGHWDTPQNLGYPINTHADELVIIVVPDGETGYISSNSLEGEGGYDIFSFNLYRDIRPIPVTYLKGKVYDADDHKPLGASFELIDLADDSVATRAKSDPVNGEFLVCLPYGRDYALNVSCPGYLFYSDHFPLLEMKIKTDPFVKDIPLQKIKAGSVMVLNNIFFDFDKYELKSTSFPELDKLVKLLKDNPGMAVEISGHTDDTGTDEYNLELSSLRAESVYHYLVVKGIDQKKLTYKGYGESRPVADNVTEAGKALNRRTEVRITSLN